MFLWRLGGSKTISGAALERGLKFIASKIPLRRRVGFAPACFDQRSKRRRKLHGRSRCGRGRLKFFRIVRRRRTRRPQWHALDDTQVPPEGCMQGRHGFLVSQMPPVYATTKSSGAFISLDTGICSLPEASEGLPRVAVPAAN